MTDLSLPWWEFIVRAALVYAALMVMVRLSGKRTVGQFTPFDLLVVMLLSESVSNGLSGGDQSVVGGLIAAATLVALNMIAAFAGSRSDKVETALEGAPVLVARNGVLFDNVIKRHRLAHSDFEKALREHDCELSDVRCAFLETDGAVSILKQKEQQ